MPRRAGTNNQADPIDLLGEPKISWNANQRAKLNSATRKYNNALRRAARAYPDSAQFLPSEVSYKDLKAVIKSARTLNNTVNRLLRATKPGALNLTEVGDGGIATRYEVREFQIAKSVMERRKSIRRKKLGIDYGQTLGRMGTLQQNNLLPDTRTHKDLSPLGLRRFIQRAEEQMAMSSSAKIKMYYNNYIKALDTVFGGYSEYDEIIGQIGRNIKSMMNSRPKALIDFFESGDEILSIEYVYSPEDRQAKLEYIRDRWLQI